jgi:Type IV secretion-system coupling protein DNA-binding domain
MCSENQPPPPPHERRHSAELTFLWGMTPLPLSYTPANFFVTGGVGSGKSITLRLLLGSVLSHIGPGLDHRVVILDVEGTAETWLGRSNLRCPLHIFNPFDQRGTAWDIAADLDSPITARKMVDVLFPREICTQPFFVDAAREILCAVCVGLIKTAPGKWTLRDILNVTENREQLRSLLSRTSQTAMAARLLNDKHTAAVLSTLATKLAPLEATAARWHHATKKLSLRDWLRGESVLVLADSPASHNSVAPLQRAIFDLLAEQILRQEDSTDRRTWIFLNNVCQAGPLSGLVRLLNLGRSKGVCVAMSFGDIGQFRNLYGQHSAEDFTAPCFFKTALRTDSQETAAWAEGHFGPPLRAADLMSLQPPGPEHGFTAFHHTLKAGTYLAHQPWEWVVANLPPRPDAAT